jgi:hypothetical protein
MFNKSKSNPSFHFITLLLYTFLLFTSCDSFRNDKQPIYEGTKIQAIHFKRFEQDLFGTNQQNLTQELGLLSSKYGSFYHSYAADILAMPEQGKSDSLYTNSMKLLLSYEPFINLYQIVDSAYHDLSKEEQELTKAMSIYKAQFPNAVIPEFVTFISEFGYANIIYDSIIGIGLDMYLNERLRPFYLGLEFPEFFIKKLQRDYIIPNVIKAMATGLYEEQSTKDKRFLAMMLVEGKIRYFTKALLPDVHDTIILGYSAEQLQWCKDNEKEIWKHFAEKELLFQAEQSNFIRYFNDGPFTSAEGVPAESAPMLGSYIGLQIIRNYINQNPLVTLSQLMEETDFDKLLKMSNYKP